MLSGVHEEKARRLLGKIDVTGEWCKLDQIPKPPTTVHAAAGNGPLRPARVPTLSVIGVVLALPLWVLFGIYVVAEGVLTLLASAFRPRKTLDGVRRSRRGLSETEKALAAHGLDQVFDGDWNGAAGQFLLRYYAQSSHPTRLVVLVPGAIVFLAPLKRVAFGKAKKMQVLVELPASQAVVESPLSGLAATTRFRIRFSDGSWFVLTAVDKPSEIDQLVDRELGDGNPLGYPVRR